MPVGNRFLAAVLVLGGGVGLALMFHKDTPPVAEAVSHLEEPIRRRADDGPRYLREVRAAPPLASMASEPAAAVKEPARPMDLLTGLPLFPGGHGPVPQIARDYPVDTEAAVEASSREPIEHRIVDGDTLAGLAQ